MKLTTCKNVKELIAMNNFIVKESEYMILCYSREKEVLKLRLKVNALSNKEKIAFIKS